MNWITQENRDVPVDECFACGDAFFRESERVFVAPGSMRAKVICGDCAESISCGTVADLVGPRFRECAFCEEKTDEVRINESANSVVWGCTDCATALHEALSSEF